MDYPYIVNKNNSIKIDNEVIMSNRKLLQAINFCNTAIQDLSNQTKKFDINIFDVLGMRNLSGLVGEYFGKSVQRFSNKNLQPNLHQDGYPDLLLTNNNTRQRYYDSLYTVKDMKKYPKDKSYFSPFKYGGVEIKATCGSTPSAKEMPKPIIGEQRIKSLVSFDWKAHHRETNNLLAIFWDFIDEIPTIAGCFYRNDLTPSDWGKIVKPKEGGGRTTSVSIMHASGVKKMCEGWLAIINFEDYIQAFSEKKWIGYRVDQK